MAVSNPWSAEFWNITAQGEYVKTYGLSVAQRTARQAGVSIGALRPAVDPNIRIVERHWVLSRKIATSDGAGGGSSGSGPPS